MAAYAEPVTDADLAFLAMDTGRVPVQFGAVLALDRHLDPARAARLLAERIPRTRRLRQRIATRGPLRRPVRENDESFTVARHLEVRHCPPPGDEAALTAVAMALLLRRLPCDRPLWRVRLVHAPATTAPHAGQLRPRARPAAAVRRRHGPPARPAGSWAARRT
ncbi:wax ester/triacylglycerol synthase family O-acyltransferase [Couchioplanes caeruleus]|uniref:wax ester/triacylglycerol synthase family O-acyltransferase n=1 Tax=Couchioplanes caeruleus TaxID=56438 RepID=UPI0020BE7AC3|nr:wax ester/triacylglycerol synthase family O-acyltransferase [Couchioplanes caeruleus]UQU61842.1 wax ester/triacylglycerol synthase family O-acyltransferase [Couchioplanes caeruleus]